jgi:tripeptidyl-peptidase-1
VEQLANPQHPKYGRWLSFEKVNQWVQPSRTHSQAVRAFIESFGLRELEQSPSGDFVRVTTSVATAERMLQCTYARFSSTRGDVTVVRTLDPYHLPAHLALALDFVQPTHHFPPLPAPAQRQEPRREGQQDGLGASPISLRRLYEVDAVEGSNNPVNRQAATGFLGQFIHAGDLQEFYKLVYPVAVNRTMYNIVGPNKGPAGVESSLDVEYITAMGGNIPSEFWSFPGSR